MSNSSEKPARSERRKRNHVGLDKGKGKARDGDGVTVLNDDNDNQRDAIPSYAPSKAQFKKYIRGADVKTASQNKKLASHLSSLAATQQNSAMAAYEHDDLLLPGPSSSRLQAEDELERTWRVSQKEILDNVGQGTAAKNFTIDLNELGPYTFDYSADGRQLAIAGRKGHVATFDWHTGKLGTEVQLKETVRDVCWLHNASFFAAAQKKYVYIYDKDGLEIHQLRNHIEVNRLEFLRHHFLLSSIGNPGFLRYQDTSTGAVVAEHRTKLGPCHVMAQNKHTGVISLGHANGTVTMWTPNISTAQVTMLAHTGPVASLAVDASSSGIYFASAGLDGSMKVWDVRKWAAINEWRLQRPASSLSFSDKGLLSAGWGNHVTVYTDVTRNAERAPGPYMTQLFPSTAVQSISFCPFEDVLGVGHARGFSSLIIPGAGEANYDSLELDPYGSKKARREGEVISLLDKLQPDQILLDPELIGRISERKAPKDILHGLDSRSKALAGLAQARPVSFAALSRIERLKMNGLDEGDDDEVVDESVAAGEPGAEMTKPRKPRGKNKVLKRIMRRKKTIIDARTMQVRELLEQRREAARISNKANSKTTCSALDRFA